MATLDYTGIAKIKRSLCSRSTTKSFCIANEFHAWRLQLAKLCAEKESCSLHWVFKNWFYNSKHVLFELVSYLPKNITQVYNQFLYTFYVVLFNKIYLIICMEFIERCMRKHLSIRYTIVTDNVFLSSIDLNKKPVVKSYIKGDLNQYPMPILGKNTVYIVDLPNMVYWF